MPRKPSGRNSISHTCVHSQPQCALLASGVHSQPQVCTPASPRQRYRARTTLGSSCVGRYSPRALQRCRRIGGWGVGGEGPVRVRSACTRPPPSRPIRPHVTRKRAPGTAHTLPKRQPRGAQQTGATDRRNRQAQEQGRALQCSGSAALRGVECSG
eukprot:3651467-Rhodomonas_salina.1